jgi:hypothetical protein
MKEYKFYKEVVGDQFELSQDMFHRMINVARSRVFKITVNGLAQNCIVPLGDYINHDHTPNCTAKFDDQRYGFTFTAIKQIAAGEELVVSYAT